MVLVVFVDTGGVLTKTQPLDPGRHPGAIATLRLSELLRREVVVPELVVTVTEVGVLIHGHHAKYQPFFTVAAAALPLANLNVTAETSLPACPSTYGP